MSVISLFLGKNKYEVVKVVWLFVIMVSGQFGCCCIVQSEEIWWREWNVLIKYVILQKWYGWVMIEDKFEVVMEGKGMNMVLIDWGLDYML